MNSSRKKIKEAQNKSPHQVKQKSPNQVQQKKAVQSKIETPSPKLNENNQKAYQQIVDLSQEYMHSLFEQVINKLAHDYTTKNQQDSTSMNSIISPRKISSNLSKSQTKQQQQQYKSSAQNINKSSYFSSNLKKFKKISYVEQVNNSILYQNARKSVKSKSPILSNSCNNNHYQSENNNLSKYQIQKPQKQKNNQPSNQQTDLSKSSIQSIKVKTESNFCKIIIIIYLSLLKCKETMPFSNTVDQLLRDKIVKIQQLKQNLLLLEKEANELQILKAKSQSRNIMK